MLAELLSLGILFWILTVCGIIALAMFVEREHYLVAIIISVVAFILYEYYGYISFFSYVRHHPLAALGWAALYIINGIIWASIKWYAFLIKVKNIYTAVRKRFIDDYNKTHPKEPLDASQAIPEELKESFQKQIRWNSKVNVKGGNIPRAINYKSDITLWLAWWPFSIIGQLTDGLWRIFDNLFEILKATYQRMADRIFKDMKQDLD